MAEIYRKAGVLWTGDLQNGSGIVSTESRALFEQPFTYQTRYEDKPGTNPEELIAAATCGMLQHVHCRYSCKERIRTCPHRYHSNLHRRIKRGWRS